MSRKSPRTKMGKLFNIDKFSSKFYPNNPVVHPTDDSLSQYAVQKIRRIDNIHKGCFTVQLKQVA